jgi:hypothetical protein
MIGFIPNEIPYKTVKKADTKDEHATSEEIDFARLWDTLLDTRSAGRNDSGDRHRRSS